MSAVEFEYLLTEISLSFKMNMTMRESIQERLAVTLQFLDSTVIDTTTN